MITTKKDTKIALEFLNGNHSKYIGDNYNYIYNSTNENLDSYYKYFPIKDKNILTIASSGDHILEAILNSSKEIVCFDKNIFSLYMSKLKIESLKVLNYDEFINFFYSSNFFNKKDYSKIRECLDENIKYFWDKLYIKGNLENNIGRLFLTNSYEYYGIYCDEDKFAKIKENSNIPITYKHTNFFDLHKVLKSSDKFSSIFLSNIPDWLDTKSRNIYYYNYIKNVLSKYLDDNGMIAIYAGVQGSRQLELEEKSSQIIDANEKTKVYVYR